MKTLRLYSKLLRTGQWHKNLVIFIPLLFAKNVHAPSLLVLAFFGFCFISSASYIINDYLDREKDRLHPIKKDRPLASGKISGKMALFVGVLLILLTILLSFVLGWYFGLIVLVYFIITNAYSFGLKNIPLLDIGIIAFNFMLRMMAGMTAFPELGQISYFLLIFASIILFISHKRRSDNKMMEENAVSHKPVLRFYTKKNTYILRILSFILIALSFVHLYILGYEPYKAFAIFLQLAFTSYLFSKHPEITTKPKYLFKNFFWVLLFLINLLLIFAY